MRTPVLWMGRWAAAGGDSLDFFDAKGVVEAMLGGIGVQASFAPRSEFGFLEGHTAEVRAGNDIVGILGQVHPDHGSVWTSTERTAGRSRTAALHVSPASADAYTCPPVVPK